MDAVAGIFLRTEHSSKEHLRVMVPVPFYFNALQYVLFIHEKAIFRTLPNIKDRVFLQE